MSFGWPQCVKSISSLLLPAIRKRDLEFVCSSFSEGRVSAHAGLREAEDSFKMPSYSHSYVGFRNTFVAAVDDLRPVQPAAFANETLGRSACLDMRKSSS